MQKNINYNESDLLYFKLKMEKSERKKNSNIILALDQVFGDTRDLFSNSVKILEKTLPFICALKLNRQLVLPLGLFNGVRKIVDLAHEAGLPVIMDCKINDVGETNRIITETYFKAGFDAVIANPFVGYEEGLQTVFKTARNLKRGVILLIYMSHKGASFGYGQKIIDVESGRQKPLYQVFAEKALSWGADGAIVGATYPEKISEVSSVLGDEIPIYSPGLGAQGGKVEEAIKSGARYLIVGIAITLSSIPEETAKEYRERFNDFKP
jgi:orotidine-5'-phosphate decarboxylase